MQQAKTGNWPMSAFTRIDEAAQKGPIGLALAVGYNRRNVHCPQGLP